MDIHQILLFQETYFISDVCNWLVINCPISGASCLVKRKENRFPVLHGCAHFHDVVFQIAA